MPAMDPATIVAASATVIALLSLVVTIVQTRVTRMHNRKSVPHAVGSRFDL